MPEKFRPAAAQHAFCHFGAQKLDPWDGATKLPVPDDDRRRKCKTVSAGRSREVRLPHAAATDAAKLWQ